nr:MAG TPA: hypothetical protein [Caudoviricetes sp.]
MRLELVTTNSKKFISKILSKPLTKSCKSGNINNVRSVSHLHNTVRAVRQTAHLKSNKQTLRGSPPRLLI